MPTLVPLDKAPQFTLVPLDKAPVITDPLPPPSGIPISNDPMGLPGGQPPLGDFEISPPKIALDAANAGVVFDHPAPKGHFRSSFAFNDDNRIKSYQKDLSEHFGKDVQVRLGEATQSIEYLDPESNRWTLAVPPGAIGELAQSNAGSIGVMLNELGAGVAAAFVTKSPALVNLSSSTATFVSEIGRIYMGKSMGINEDISDEEIIQSALGQAGTAFVAGFGMDKALQLGGFIIDLMKGRVVPKGALDQLDMTAGEAAQIEDAVNNVVGAGRLKYTLAQASNDEDLLAAQEVMMKSREFSRQFATRFDEQQSAIKDFYSAINEPYNSPMTAVETAQGIGGVADAQVQQRLAEASKDLQDYESTVQNALSYVRDTPWSPETGSGVRDFISQEQAAFRDWADDAAAKLNSAVGDSAFIYPTNTSRVMAAAREETSNILIPALRGRRTALTETVDDETKLAKKLYDKDTPLTFQEMWATASSLKRMIRDAATGGTTETPEIGLAKRIVSALEQDMAAGMQGSSARAMYDDFINAYRKGKDRLDRGTVGKVMQQSNGRYVVSDEQVFQRAFTPGQARNTTEFMNVIGSEPGLVRGFQEAIGDFYKNGFRGGVVDANGRINVQKHQDFMRLYKASLKAAKFTDTDIAVMEKFGTVGTVLRKKQEQLDRATQLINQSFDAKIADIRDPKQLFALIRDPDTAVENIERLKPIIASHPELLNALQTQYRRDMQERIMGQFQGQERVISFPRLNDYLFGKSGEKGHINAIRSLFGDEYADNLRTISAALGVVNREARFPGRSNTAFWADTLKNLGRAYVGLFTRPGRIITAVDRLRGRAANRVLANAMLNPEAARDLAALRGVDLRSRKAAVLIGNMGGSALLQDFSPEASQMNLTPAQRGRIWNNEQSVQ